MKKLLKSMAAFVLAASIIPAYAVADAGKEGDNQKPSRISQCIELGVAACGTAAAALAGKWAVTTMISDHTLYAERAQKADTIYQGLLDLISKGAVKLRHSQYHYGTPIMASSFEPPLEPVAALELSNRISTVPTDQTFLEAAKVAAGNWHITIPVLGVAVLICAASAGYIYEHFFKDANKEEDDDSQYQASEDQVFPDIA